MSPDFSYRLVSGEKLVLVGIGMCDEIYKIANFKNGDFEK